MKRKLFVEINGKMEEFHSPNAIEEPVFANDGIPAVERDFSEEIIFSANQKDMQTFIKRMQKELFTVDITNWPAWLIKRLLHWFPATSKLVTRDAGHYQSLQMEEGFSCVAGDYDKLFGVPLILDKKGKIKAAQVEIKTEGGGADVNSGKTEQNT